MKVIVMSLGGSLIVPSKIDYKFLKIFKSKLLKLRDCRFVVVAGGGSVARDYINVLQKEKVNERLLCLMGVGITRLNARLMANFFNGRACSSLPSSMRELKKMLKKNRIVFTGGLSFLPENTSDGTAASIAKEFKTDFINMTNVEGLYNKDPRKFKNAQLIKKISFDEFDKIVKKLKYHPGQHFVLDQHASEIIRKNKIKTYIIGNDLKNLEDLVKGKKFFGTVIY